jgi:hypothetical protein
MTGVTRRTVSLHVVVLAFLLALVSCGGSPETDPQADLRARVNAVSAAVDARDPETARSALNGLRDAVLEHRLNGEIDFDKAQAITTAANHVEEHLGELDKPPPTPTPTDSTEAAG